MAIPHHFPSLIEGTVQVVIFAGAGLSKDNVPVVDELLPKLKAIAHDLGVPPDEDFYVLAEGVLEKLVNDKGMSDSTSRLDLAKQLGILDDRKWFGDLGLPLAGNTPRHRAIARFAVENRLRAIVSLNWDALLEAALDSVGLSEDIGSPRPWQVTAYSRVIDNSHLPKLANVNVFPVIKPHGCVRDLKQRQANGTTLHLTFKLKKSELSTLPTEQSQVDKYIDVYLSTCPLIAVGWKATEDYLRSTVIHAVTCSPRTEQDAFTLVNRSWYPNARCSSTFHDEIAAAYNTSKPAAYVAVGAPPGQPTCDFMFQWLQSRYALTRLIAVSSDPQKTKLVSLLTQIGQPDIDHPVLGWADKWLPSWVRLCWRAGVVQGTDPATGRAIDPYEIPIVPRDIHVPLGSMTGVRLELQAAAMLLATLSDTLGKFKFDLFPGGLWDEAERSLYLPLPSWGRAADFLDLSALSPLIEAMHNFGFVQTIKLVSLNAQGSPADDTICQRLAAQVSRLMHTLNFASTNSISWVSLEDIKGEPCATLA